MHFLRPDGSPKKPGEWIVQDDLAKVLQAISDEGSDVFYKGWIAEKIVEDNKANGGVLSMQALAEYEAMESHIVEGNIYNNRKTILRNNVDQRNLGGHISK